MLIIGYYSYVLPNYCHNSQGLLDLQLVQKSKCMIVSGYAFIIWAPGHIVMRDLRQRHCVASWVISYQDVG